MKRKHKRRVYLIRRSKILQRKQQRNFCSRHHKHRKHNNNKPIMYNPIRHIGTDYLPLVYDDDYEIIDEKILAKYIGEIILGYYAYVKDIIDQLDNDNGPSNNEMIDAAIAKLNDLNIEHLKGYLFQHMSWIALATKYHSKNLRMFKPHDAAAQHGIDGLALLLDDDNNIKTIIITEDKCTKEPRNVMTNQVFPEFDEYENGKCYNKIISGIESLIGEDRTLRKRIMVNVANKNLWQYRIGISRGDTHNGSDDRRKALFKDYEKHVADPKERRHAATIYIADTNAWAINIKDKVITYLNSKKTK